MAPNKRIAIVYDWLDKWGGVERILLTLHEMFPKAVFYTSYFDRKTASWAGELKIKPSFLQKMPEVIKKNRKLSFLFYPYVFETFDFSGYDLVISVTSSFAKSIITKPATKHICYLLSPARYLWSHEKEYLKNNLMRVFLKGYLDGVRKWDLAAAQRPDKIISISETVKQRCLKYYGRNSEVIYPGFDLNYWGKIKNQILNIKMTDQNLKAMKNKKYFLLVSRLEPYKKVDLAVKVFNKLNKQLIIVGEGTEEKKLKKMAEKNIVFLSKLTDDELGGIYSGAQALIMPQEEDFGLVSLEAQFFGCPVITLNKGGGSETVADGKTGIFFQSQNEESLIRAIERFAEIGYNLRKSVLKRGMENIRRFDKEVFVRKFGEMINDK